MTTIKHTGLAAEEKQKIDNYEMPPLKEIYPGSDILLMAQFIEVMKRDYVYSKIKGEVANAKIPHAKVVNDCAYFFRDKWASVREEWDRLTEDTIARTTYRGLKEIHVAYLDKEEKEFIPKVRAIVGDNPTREEVLQAIKQLEKQGIKFTRKYRNKHKKTK